MPYDPRGSGLFPEPTSWNGDPDDYYNDDEPQDECEHEDYESDILTGRATCNMCGFAWWQTQEEIDAEIERIRAYDEWQREQESPWFRFKEWVRSWRFRLRYRWDTRHWAKLTDDEIPF